MQVSTLTELTNNNQVPTYRKIISRLILVAFYKVMLILQRKWTVLLKGLRF